MTDPAALAEHYGFSEQPTTQENPMPDSPRPTLAEQAAAASTPAADDAEEHAAAGAFARSVLTEQLEAAREAHAGSLDLLQLYQDQADAELVVVQRLETAIADLDAAAKRKGDLERTILDGDPHR